jgi:hypothetical protein
MAQQDEGIMALMGAGAGSSAMGATPEDPPVDMLEFRKEAYPVVKDSVREVSPEAYGEMDSMLSSEIASIENTDPAELEQLLQIVDYINENPGEYAEIRAALISADVIDADDFPEEMDVEYFAAMEVVLQEALMQQGAERADIAQGPVEMAPPQGFAKGGIAEAAKLVASKGRYGDTMLAHITPAEARMLKARGGSGTVNPKTGLPEFFIKKLVKSVVKSVKKVVKKVLASPIGRIVATVGLTMVGVPPWLASGLVTKAAGGSWKDALKAAAVSYLGSPSSPIANFVKGATPFLDGMSGGVQAGIRAGLTSTGAALLTGSSLKEAVAAGITSGLTTGIKDPTGEWSNQAPNAAPVTDANIQTPDQVLGGSTGAITSPVSAGAATGTGLPFLGDPAQAMQQVTAAPTAGQAGIPLASSDSAFNQALSGAQAGTGQAAQQALTGARPTLMDSLGQAAKGAGQVLTGDFREGFSNLGTGLGDTFMPKSYTPDELSARAIALQKNAASQGGNMTFSEAMKLAGTENPGIMRTYGPAIAGGLGLMAMTGGFKQEELPETEFAKRMRTPIDVPPVLQKPLQNLPGVEYDEAGNIIGSKAWSPRANMGPAEVATPGIMSLPTPATYTPPPGAPTAMGQGPVAQPYNTSGMYNPYFFMQPRGYNRGGVAALAQGGYPRRIGQISGPGTETSDDIPAMLSDGEFVMTARAVRGAGNGDRREGAKKMYAMMHQLEQNAARG